MKVVAKFRRFINDNEAVFANNATLLRCVFRSVAKSIKVFIRSSFALLMLTGSVEKMNKSFFSPPLSSCFVPLSPHFLPPFLAAQLRVPFLLVLEMDVGLPGEGDSSINALCCQINTSFTKPSDELFSDPSLPTNGPPTCAVPPVLPPPATMQGKRRINGSVNILGFFAARAQLSLYLSLFSHFFLGSAGAFSPLSSPSVSGDADANADADADAEWPPANTLRG